jgi:hypothetical protein
MNQKISLAALAAALLAAPAASATTVNFDDFSATQGTTSGTDGLGNNWTIAQTGEVWVFKYAGTYNSSFAYPSASDFEVTFGPPQITISGAAAGTDAGPWNVTFADPTVSFAGPSLVAGQGFLFSVDFISPTGVPSPSFTASWSTAVPELSTWAMMGLGFGGLAFASYRARRSATRNATQSGRPMRGRACASAA